MPINWNIQVQTALEQTLT